MGDEKDVYRDKYFEEKFGNINSRLDTLLQKFEEDKASDVAFALRLTQVEQFQSKCDLPYVKDKVRLVSEETEVVRFFQKRATLLKLTITGFIFLTFANLGLFALQVYKLINTVPH